MGSIEHGREVLRGCIWASKGNHRKQADAKVAPPAHRWQIHVARGFQQAGTQRAVLEKIAVWWTRGSLGAA
mgnify:CR=1 FL=1